MNALAVSLRSHAISLRRQADDLERLAASLESTPGQNKVLLLSFPARATDTIIAVVSSVFGIAPDAIVGRGRDRGTIEARFTTAWIIRETIGGSAHTIAKRLGLSDHGSVLNAWCRVNDWREVDNNFRARSDLALSQARQRLATSIAA